MAQDQDAVPTSVISDQPTEFFHELQPFVPFPQAIRWDIQAKYYGRKGLDAWLDNEVPTAITTNSFAALNNATLVFEAVMQQEARGALGPEDPVVVMEYGAGLGLFAYNFIRRFEQVCRREQKNFGDRLQYIASDYLPELIQGLCRQPFLKKDIQAGKLRVAVADVTAAGPLQFFQVSEDESSETVVTSEEMPRLSAIITNYLHCCLPIEVLQQEGDAWSTKSVRTGVRLTASEAEASINTTELLASDSILDRLEEQERWDPIDLASVCQDEQHQYALKSVVSGRQKSNLLNPVGSFKSLKTVFSPLLEGGVYLIHDKGIVKTSAYDYEATEGRSTHGGSTAFMTNFPVLKVYAEAIGYQGYLTQSYHYSIQTLVLEKSTTPSHRKTFRYLYGDFNLNSDLIDLQRYAQALAAAGDLKKAAEALQKCLRYRSLDAELYFLQADWYLQLGIPQRTLLCLQKGRLYDHYGQYNFTMLEAQAHLKLGNHTLAANLFNRALAVSQDRDEMQQIEAGLFEAHGACGLATEDFTPERYAALSRLHTVSPSPA